MSSTVRPSAAPFHHAPGQQPGFPPQPPRKSNGPLIIAIVVLLVLIVIGTVTFVVTLDTGATVADTTDAAAAADAPAAADATDAADTTAEAVDSAPGAVDAEEMTDMIEGAASQPLGDGPANALPRPEERQLVQTAPQPLAPAPEAPPAPPQTIPQPELPDEMADTTFDTLAASARPIAPGGEAVVRIGPEDAAVVSFTLVQGQLFTIRAASAGDPFLVLYGPDGQVVTTDDDGGVGANAVIASTGAGATGTYLAAAVDDGGAPVDVEFSFLTDEAVFEVADVANQSIADGDVAVFPVELFAGEEARALVVADGPVLVGFGQDGDILQVSEPFGGDPLTQLVRFDVPSEGEYDIVIFADDGPITVDLFADVSIR